MQPIQDEELRSKLREILIEIREERSRHDAVMSHLERKISALIGAGQKKTKEPQEWELEFSNGRKIKVKCKG